MSQTQSTLPTMGPNPVIENRTSAPFWAGVREHRLMLQYDPVAKRYQFYPRPISLYGASTELEWKEASGEGSLAAFTLTHFPTPGFEAITPYIEVLVQLDEGPLLFAPLQGASYEELSVGQRVRIAWPRNTGEPSHPFWFERISDGEDTRKETR